MVDALNTTTCLFLGTSLNDPNLIRYLYGHDRQEELRHVALFVRRAARTDVETLVRKFREEAVAARWKRCDVAAAFVEHYGDIPQFVHEAARSRTQGDAYRAVETRTAAWIRDVERTILGTADDHAFRESQAQLSEYLRVALAEGVNAAAEAGADLSEEVLAVGLWLVSEDGSSFTNWVTSDRAYQQTATMSPIRIAADPKWVAIEAFTRGVLIEQTRDVYASRWRYIRGLPLRVDQESLGGVLVGAVTITSTKPKDESALEAMPDAVKAAFNDILMSAAKSVFEPAA
jgi:hypothetical protein